MRRQKDIYQDLEKAKRLEKAIEQKQDLEKLKQLEEEIDQKLVQAIEKFKKSFAV